MTTATTPGGSGRLTTIAMILAVSMSFIDQTIIAIASPDLQRDLHLTGTQGQWVVTAYLVALAATFALGGRLADVWGRRRMAVTGIIGFATMSALCGAVPDTHVAETWLITARAGQGFFAALLLPAAIAIVYSSAPAARRGRSMAMFFGITGAFTALGPVLGTYLLEYSWRAIFWVNIPVALAALAVLAVAKIPDTRFPGRIDWVGAAVLAGGMSLSVIGMTQASAWGWQSAATWGCLGGGGLLLVLFVAVERRIAEPLVTLSLFGSRGFAVDSAVLGLLSVVFVPLSYFLSLYASVSLGLGTRGTTNLLLMFFLGYLVAAQVGGRIFDSRGARPTILLGAALGVAGLVWWAIEIPHLDASRQTHPLLLTGAGIGLLLGPSSSDAVSRAGRATYGQVTGLNQTVRNYGAAAGFAVLGTVLAHVFTARFTDSLVAAGVPASRAGDIAAASASGAPASSSDLSALSESVRTTIEAAAAHDFALGMQAVVIAMAIALALTFLVALRHPGDRPAQPSQPDPGEAIGEAAQPVSL